MAEAPHGESDALRAALDDRYGRRAPRSRRTVIVLAAAAAVALAAVVVLGQISGEVTVRTQEVAFRVVDSTRVEVGFHVMKDTEVVADCTVIALNESFAEVGVATVRVGPDASDVVPVTAQVRTTEPASGARVDGCVAVRGG